MWFYLLFILSFTRQPLSLLSGLNPFTKANKWHCNCLYLYQLEEVKEEGKLIDLSFSHPPSLSPPSLPPPFTPLDHSFIHLFNHSFFNIIIVHVLFSHLQLNQFESSHYRQPHMNHQTNPLMMMMTMMIPHRGHSGCCSSHSQLDEVKEGEGERRRGGEGRRADGRGGFKL